MPAPLTMSVPMFKLMMCFVGIMAVIGIVWIIKVFLTTMTRLCDESYFHICTHGSSAQKYDNVAYVTNILNNNIDRSLNLLEKDETLREFCNFERIRSAVKYELQYINYATNQSIKNSWLPFVGFDMSDKIRRISKMICYRINHQLAMKNCNQRYTYLQNDNNCANFYVIALEKHDGTTYVSRKKFTIYSLENISNGRKKHLIDYDDHFYNELTESSFSLEVMDTSIITGKLAKYIVVTHPDYEFSYNYLKLHMYSF